MADDLWFPITFDGCSPATLQENGGGLLARLSFGDASYALVLTDLARVWSSSVDEVEFQQLRSAFHPGINSPDADLLAILVHAFASRNGAVQRERRGALTAELLSDGAFDHSAATSKRQRLATGDGGRRREVQSTLFVEYVYHIESYRFFWHFNCAQLLGDEAAALLRDSLFVPIMCIGAHLLGRVEQLKALLLQRDAVVQLLQEQAAAAAARRPVLPRFDPQRFDAKLVATARLTARPPAELWADDGLVQRIFTAFADSRPTIGHRSTSTLSGSLPHSLSFTSTSSSASTSVDDSPAAALSPVQRREDDATQRSDATHADVSADFDDDAEQLTARTYRESQRELARQREIAERRAKETRKKRTKRSGFV